MLIRFVADAAAVAGLRQDDWRSIEPTVQPTSTPPAEKIAICPSRVASAIALSIHR